MYLNHDDELEASYQTRPRFLTTRRLCKSAKIAKVYGKSNAKCRLYVGKVKDYDKGGYISQIFKKVPFTKKFSPNEKESFVRKTDIVRKLGAPYRIIALGSSCYNNMITFYDDLSGLSIYWKARFFVMILSSL